MPEPENMYAVIEYNHNNATNNVTWNTVNENNNNSVNGMTQMEVNNV